MSKDNNLVNKPGFSYFISTPCEDWDALEYCQEWYAMKYEMNKSKIKTALTRQLKWFTSSGSQEEKSAASKMLNQFQNDSNPGGRIYDFWASIFADDKADFKKKVIDAKVREIQADKHLLMNKRSLNVLKETIVEHNETSIILADFARAEQDVRKRRKQYHQLDGHTTPSPGSPIKYSSIEEKEGSPKIHSSIEEEGSLIKHLSEEENPFIEEEEDEIIIDDIPYGFSFENGDSADDLHVGKTNVSIIFRNYQNQSLNIARDKGLFVESNVQEILSLSSIILLAPNSYSRTMIDHFGLSLLDEIHQNLRRINKNY